MKKGISNHIVYKNGSEARKLCRAALKKFRTVRNAARALRMTPMEFSNQLRGIRRETPAMVCALKRAEKRAQKAKFFLLDEHGEGTIDRIMFEMQWRELKQKFETMERLLSR